MIYRQNLEYNSTQRKSWIWSLTPLLTSKRHHTLYNRTSIDWSCIHNAGHLGDAGNVVALAVAVAAGNGLAAAGDGRPTHRQNSWELHASFSSSNKAAETMKSIVGLLSQLLQDVIKEVLIKAALIIVRWCHCSVCTGGVDPSANHAVDIAYGFVINHLDGRIKMRVQMTKYICAFIMPCVIIVSCIALTLCCTSLTKLWRDPKLTCFPGRQTILDGPWGEGNECWVDFINHWSIFHSCLSYEIAVRPVNMINNFSCCKSILALQIDFQDHD